MQPYDPQRPSAPEVFAGRTDLVAFVDGAVRDAAEGRRGSALLLFGYRGAGKTSALRKIEAMVHAGARRSVVVEVPLRVPSSEATLVHGVAESVRRQVAAQGRLGGRVKDALESLRSVTVMGTGIERAPAPSEPDPALLTVWKDTLAALAGCSLLNICIDDAELLRSGEIGILKTMVESDSPVPLLLAVAGGPELLEKLSRREASPILRAFSGAVFDIGQFTVEETRDALNARVQGRRGAGRWDRSAVDAIHHLTQGYPYLVQCFAAACYREGRAIGAADVRSSVPAALRVASSWLERELPSASDEDIRAFARIGRLGKSELRSSEIARLGINPIYLRRLTEQGVLKRLARGRYELRAAPAIAYFHALQRGLALD